jgi:hypothetical protein
VAQLDCCEHPPSLVVGEQAHDGGCVERTLTHQ